MAVGALSDQKLNRLKEALIAAGVVRGVRDKTVAAATGYAEGSTRRLLSGSTPLTGRFIKSVCLEFNIRLKWVEEGEEPMLTRPGEQPYPSRGYRGDIPQIVGVDSPESKPHAIAQPIAGLPYPRAIAGPEGGMSAVESSDHFTAAGTVTQQMGESEYTALLQDIRNKIRLYLTSVDESGVLGWAADLNFLNMVLLPPHEMIDLVYQFRKLYDGDSDQLATIAADERLARSGIKPTTRLKLERIPVAPAEEKQEK